MWGSGLRADSEFFSWRIAQSRLGTDLAFSVLLFLPDLERLGAGADSVPQELCRGLGDTQISLAAPSPGTTEEFGKRASKAHQFYQFELSLSFLGFLNCAGISGSPKGSAAPFM